MNGRLVGRSVALSVGSYSWFVVRFIRSDSHWIAAATEDGKHIRKRWRISNWIEYGTRKTMLNSSHFRCTFDAAVIHLRVRHVYETEHAGREIKFVDKSRMRFDELNGKQFSICLRAICWFSARSAWPQKLPNGLPKCLFRRLRRRGPLRDPCTLTVSKPTKNERKKRNKIEKKKTFAFFSL